MDRADPSVLLNPGVVNPPTPGLFRDPTASFSVYLPVLLEQWVPELDGVEPRLREGALGPRLDMAAAQRRWRLPGRTRHRTSSASIPDASVVRRAQQRAEEQGISECTTFEQAAPEAIPNHRYALVVLLSGLAGSRDPMGVAWRALTTLDPAGSLLIVEPRAIPAGPGCVSSPGSGLAQAGFKRVRLIDQTAFARVFEARR